MREVSIIITALDEQYLQPTIGTLFQRTPFDMIESIIVVDDASSKPVSINLPKVKVLHNNTRQGLIRSRQIATQAAGGKIIVSIDAHVKVGPNWLPPVVDRIMSDYQCVCAPMTRSLDAEKWKEGESLSAKTSWNWDLNFGWCKDDGTPQSPALAGHCFAYSREWWKELGGFDEGMLKWGGENIEFTLKTWLCGGTVEIIRDSWVAHLFKKKFQYQMDNNTLLANKARIAEVWFDQHAEIFYAAVRKQRGSINFGDISRQQNLRRSRQRMPFEWFLDNISTDLNSQYKLRQVHKGASFAIVGAGPSLDQIPLDQIRSRHDIVMCVNYSALHLPADYAIFHDLTPAKAVYDSKKYKADRLLVPLNVKDGSKQVPYYKVGPGLTPYMLGKQDDPRSLDSVDPPFFHHASTVHTAMHIAAYMGASSITLYGCDGKVTSDGRSHTSLFKEYRGGHYWKSSDVPAYLRRMQLGHDQIAKALASWGISLTRV